MLNSAASSSMDSRDIRQRHWAWLWCLCSRAPLPLHSSARRSVGCPSHCRGRHVMPGGSRRGQSLHTPLCGGQGVPVAHTVHTRRAHSAENRAKHPQQGSQLQVVHLFNQSHDCAIATAGCRRRAEQLVPVPATTVSTMPCANIT